MHYAVCVDIKLNLNLGNSTRSGSYARKLETPKGFIVLGKFAFALKDVYLYACLPVGGR